MGKGKKSVFDVKVQYSLLQGLYWMTSCCLGGYVAVYLQYRGLSNTLIGFVVGGAAFLSMLAQPTAAKLVASIPVLTIKRALQLLIVLIAGLFSVMTLLPLPIAAVMVIYMTMNTLNYCIPPMSSAMGMEYINQGYYLNFGLSRGIGSICYAVCAAGLGWTIEQFSPGILGYIYVVFAGLLFLVISVMEDLGKENGMEKREEKKAGEDLQKRKREGIFRTIGKDPVFVCLLVGFCLANMSNSTIATYNVNIIHRLGGSNTTLGIANFISAASEMPVMMLFGFFLKKTNCIRLLKISAFCYLLKPLILLVATHVGMVFLGLGMQSFSFGLFTPAAVYYVNSTLHPEDRVQGQSVFSMITSGGAVCGGNLLGGWIQDTFGLQVMLILCAGMALVGFLTVVRLPETSQS